MSTYLELYALTAAGFSLREGYARGPGAEGPIWIWASTYEDAVWHTWCYVFRHYHLQEHTHVFPERPNDWRDRISVLNEIWEKAQTDGRKVLEEQ